MSDFTAASLPELIKAEPFDVAGATVPALRVAGKAPESIVDGPGLRYCLFLQGCPHGCPGCHNPETHAFSGGKLVSVERIFNDICENPLLRGVTFSGGEPFCQSLELIPLASALRACGYHLMAYTGFVWEELVDNPQHRSLLEYLDVLVDGPFVLAQRTLTLPFRGSANQRMVNVAASLTAGKYIPCV